MNELIAIHKANVGQGTIDAVAARELHAFLEVGKDFTSWMKDRIEQYGFIDGQDFAVFTGLGENLKGGRPSKEYVITLDMAKELAMVERNDKGKQARQYFIECERKLKSAVPALPNFADPVAAARAWADAKEAEQKALADLAAAKPAVEFVERYVESTGSKGVREVAKLLVQNERNLIKILLSLSRYIMHNVQSTYLYGWRYDYKRKIDSGC